MPDWNILYDFNHGKKTEEGIAWIKSRHANVIALQELTKQKNESFSRLASRWTSLLIRRSK